MEHFSRVLKTLSSAHSIAGAFSLLILAIVPSAFATHTVVGTNFRVTISGNTASQAEVVVAASPTSDSTLVAGYMELSGNSFKLGHAKSIDKGTTWQNQALFSLTGYDKSVDPAVAFNAAGTSYFSGVVESSGSCLDGGDKSNCNASLMISKSTDSGTTWATPYVFKAATCSNGSGTYHDKPAMKIDTGSSQNSGKVFVSWTRIDGCPADGSAPTPPSSIMFARLTDTGSSFTVDVETRIDGASGGGSHDQIQWSDIVVAPNGDVYVGWARVTSAPSTPNERIAIAKSTNGGQTFTTLSFPVSVTPSTPPPPADRLYRPSFEIDVDPQYTNYVYLVYQDNAFGNAEVRFRRSSDYGASWSSLITIPSSTIGVQAFPSMSVVPGRVDIVWYDGRDYFQLNDKLDVYYAKSLDNGQSFVPNIRVNEESVPTSSTFGDYIGIWSSHSYAYALWTGKLPGATDNRDPIFDLLSLPDQGTPGGGSVAYGTLITMADGTRVPVQNLANGDHVLMYDVYTRASFGATITSIPRTSVNNMLIIYTEDGIPLRVDANPRLKFYVWTTTGPMLKPVTEFHAGDSVYNYDRKAWLPITRIEILYGGSHLYFDILTNPYLTSQGQYLSFIANGYADPCNPVCKEGPS